jgi:hypothetical protein
MISEERLNNGIRVEVNTGSNQRSPNLLWTSSKVRGVWVGGLKRADVTRSFVSIIFVLTCAALFEVKARTTCIRTEPVTDAPGRLKLTENGRLFRCGLPLLAFSCSVVGHICRYTQLYPFLILADLTAVLW